MALKMSIGQGYDIHRLVAGRRLVLGGEQIPFERGLEGHSDADVLLHALPIFHVHGLFVANHCALLSGARMLWHRRFDARAVLRDLPRATVLMGVPTFYTRLLAEPGFGPAAAAHMRLFVSGSAPLALDTFREFEARMGTRILERYGMSEAGMITSNPLHGERRGGTVGRGGDTGVRAGGGAGIDAGASGGARRER